MSYTKIHALGTDTTKFPVAIPNGRINVRQTNRKDVALTAEFFIKAGFLGTDRGAGRIITYIKDVNGLTVESVNNPLSGLNIYGDGMPIIDVRLSSNSTVITKKIFGNTKHEFISLLINKDDADYSQFTIEQRIVGNISVLDAEMPVQPLWISFSESSEYGYYELLRYSNIFYLSMMEHINGKGSYANIYTINCI